VKAIGREQVAIQNLEAQAWLDHAEKRPETEALARSARSSGREDATEKKRRDTGTTRAGSRAARRYAGGAQSPAEASVEYRATLQEGAASPPLRGSLSASLHTR